MRKKAQFDGCSSCDCSSITGQAVAVGASAVIRGERYQSTSRSWLVRKIDFYQQIIDPRIKAKKHVKRICKYHPTCSEYSKQAIKKHGTAKGLVLAVWRLLRCNPFSKGGYDPVK